MQKTKLLVIISLALLVLPTALAQKAEKPWMEWSKKEAQKILEESPWAQVQNDTDTSQMFYSPTQDSRTMGTTSNDSSRLGQGATNQSVNVKFYVRFFSARPIRQALARLMELNQNLDGKTAPEAVARLRSFAELKSTNSIIITVTYESSDQRYSGVVMQAFNSATTGSLKNESYLQRSDGEKLFLEEYVPPGKDGFGARFIFLREVNGHPFIPNTTGDLQFYAKYPNGIKIGRRFKLAQMMYQGELEY